MTIKALNSGTVFRTQAGLLVDFANPSPDQICVDDIVLGLASCPRFVGQMPVAYTVAEHSIFVSRLVPRGMALLGLLHDATEAYTGDLPKPLKNALGANIKRIEGRLHAAICAHFGVRPAMPEEIKRADLVALATEQRDLCGLASADWDVPDGVEADTGLIVPVDSRATAALLFRQRLDDLRERMVHDPAMSRWAA